MKNISGALFITATLIVAAGCGGDIDDEFALADTASELDSKTSCLQIRGNEQPLRRVSRLQRIQFPTDPAECGVACEFYGVCSAHPGPCRIDKQVNGETLAQIFHYYDRRGNHTGFEQVSSINFAHHYQRDKLGRVVADEFDHGSDGTIDYARRFYYGEDDAKPKLVEDDIGNDGTVEFTTVFTYDKYRFIRTKILDYSPGAPGSEITVEYRYDERGNTVRMDHSFDGTPIQTDYYTHDQRGNILEHGQDWDNDGNPDDTWDFEYDERGDLIRQRDTYYEYFDNGDLATKSRGTNRDVFSYECFE